MQFSASLSGASSGSGKDGWLRRTHSLEVTASTRVSRLAGALSRVRRMSAEENRVKTSSADSGNSQNCRRRGQQSGGRGADRQAGILPSSRCRRQGSRSAQKGG